MSSPQPAQESNITPNALLPELLSQIDAAISSLSLPATVSQEWTGQLKNLLEQQ
jgi:hypothetical protein